MKRLWQLTLSTWSPREPSLMLLCLTSQPLEAALFMMLQVFLPRKLVDLVLCGTPGSLKGSLASVPEACPRDCFLRLYMDIWTSLSDVKGNKSFYVLPGSSQIATRRLLINYENLSFNLGLSQLVFITKINPFLGIYILAHGISFPSSSPSAFSVWLTTMSSSSQTPLYPLNSHLTSS